MRNGECTKEIALREVLVALFSKAVQICRMYVHDAVDDGSTSEESADETSTSTNTSKARNELKDGTRNGRGGRGKDVARAGRDVKKAVQEPVKVPERSPLPVVLAVPLHWTQQQRLLIRFSY